MDDGFESGEAVGSADEEGGELLFADFDEVGGVGAVVTADDEEDVEGLLEEFEEGVLALLGGTADGVEDLEVGGADRGAVAIEDGLLEAALDFLGFGFEHGGLVGDADATEMEVGVKALREAAFEAGQEGSAVTAVADVVADGFDIGEGEDDEVVAVFLVAKGTGGGGAGFLVGGFAVDDGGETVAGIGANAFPDAHDVAASGVDHGAAALLDEFHEASFGAEGGDDDDVFRGQRGDLGEVLFDGNADDAFFIELAIDLGVVDNFAEQEDAIVGEDAAGGVGEVDGAFDAVAEAEVTGEANDGLADLDDAAFGANGVDERAAVVGVDLGLDAFHHLRGADIDAAFDGRRGRRRGTHQQGQSIRVEAALSGIGKDLRAEHVGHGGIRQGGVVEDGEGFADGGIFGVAGSDVDGGADGDHVEDFLGGLDGEADAAVGAGVGFDEAPVHAVGGGVEGHPVGHGVAGAGLALAAAVGHFALDAVHASGGGVTGFADGAGGGEQDAAAFHDVEALGDGADFDFDGGGVRRLLSGRVELGGVVAAPGCSGGAACKAGGGGEKNEAREGAGDDFVHRRR